MRKLDRIEQKLDRCRRDTCHQVSGATHGTGAESLSPTGGGGGI